MLVRTLEGAVMVKPVKPSGDSAVVHVLPLAMPGGCAVPPVPSLQSSWEPTACTTVVPASPGITEPLMAVMNAPGGQRM
jgi:hypothetical protein